VVSRIIDCGRGRGTDGLGIDSWKHVLCGIDPISCPPIPDNPTPDAFATQNQTPTGWLTIALWCPSTATPAPAAATLRQQILTLLTPVPIGQAPPNGTGLVNLESLYWATTTTTRDLGTITITGQPVALRAQFVSATWDFGDTTRPVTTTNPGRPFTTTDHCATAQCPDFFGHTYTHPGHYTTTLTVTWTGQYATPDGTWTTIPDPIPGPTAATQATIAQAHTVLLPN
jgi:hypothetical protein